MMEKKISVHPTAVKCLFLILLLITWILIYILTVELFFGLFSSHPALLSHPKQSIEVSSKPTLNVSFNTEIYCLEDTQKHSSNIQEFVGLTNDSRGAIFLIETTCRSVNTSKLTVTARQACALESAAKMNPNSDVYFLLLAQTNLITDDDSINSQILKQLLTYQNIRIYHLNVSFIIQGSMLDEWYREGVIKTSPFAVSHISDMLRFYLLWKYGGTYLDLDTVVKYPLENLAPNYAGIQREGELNGAVMNFARNGVGHRHVEEVLYDFRNDYRPDIWAYNGPDKLTRLYSRLCGTNDTTIMRREICDDLELHSDKEFYPVYWSQWKKYFDIETSDDVMKLLRPAKVIHVWNKVSSQEKVRVGSNAPYGLIADEFCPNVYRNCGEFF